MTSAWHEKRIKKAEEMGNSLEYPYCPLFNE